MGEWLGGEMCGGVSSVHTATVFSVRANNVVRATLISSELIRVDLVFLSSEILDAI